MILVGIGVVLLLFALYCMLTGEVTFFALDQWIELDISRWEHPFFFWLILVLDFALAGLLIYWGLTGDVTAEQFFS